MFRNVTKIRNIFGSRQYSSFIRDIRNKIEISRCEKDDSLRNGSYLILVRDHLEVLVSVNPGKVSGMNLSRVCYNELNSLGIQAVDSAFLLSSENEKPVYAVDVVSKSNVYERLLNNDENRKYVSLRSALFHFDDCSQAALLSKSFALIDWKKNHQFCSYCGNKMETDMIRIRKSCNECKKIYYPPVNPVGITLVQHSERDEVLLVRQHSHPPKMFTCIAGFIEPGESLEENVRREVAEEVGVEVRDVQYVASQHWALTGSSLMIGCFASTKDNKFSIDPVELEAAGWFNRMQVKRAFDKVSEKKEKLLTNPDEIWIPPPGAVAHSLIKKWLQI